MITLHPLLLHNKTTSIDSRLALSMLKVSILLTESLQMNLLCWKFC